MPDESNEIQRKLALLRERLPQVISKSLKRGLTETLGRVRTDRISGQLLHVRSGNLRRSGFVAVDIDGPKVRGRIGFRAIYANVQEKGTTGAGGELPDIKPVNVQWLTIPLAAAKTAAGVARGGARTFSDTFFFTSKKGNLILAQKAGKDFVPLFVLKKQVAIPPRAFLKPQLESDKEAILDEVKQAVSAEIRQVIR